MLPLNNKIMNIYSKNDSNLQESGHFDKVNMIQINIKIL